MFTFVSRHETVLGFPCPINVAPAKSRKKMRFDKSLPSGAPAPHVATYPDNDEFWDDEGLLNS